MTGTINSRKHNRVAVSLQVQVNSESGRIYKTITRDISFSGISFENSEDQKFNDGEKCTIDIFLSDTAVPAISCECRVAHKTGFIIGCEYLSLGDIESYNHLKNLIVHNSSDPDSLLDELARNPGIVMADNKK
jgi:hypothetical protein